MQRTIVPITIVEGKHNELKSFISEEISEKSAQVEPNPSIKI